MSWTIEIKPTAVKQYRKLDTKTKSRLKKALQNLKDHNLPIFHPQIRALTGQLKGDYRLRVGDWRVLLTPDHEEKVLFVYAFLPRGSAY